MRLRLEPRPAPSTAMLWFTPLLALMLMLVTGLAVFTAMGQSPVAAFYSFFISPIDNRYGFGELLLKATPLCLIAIGLAWGFRAGVWNIGAEGQLTFGAISAGGLALLFHDSESAWLLPGMVVLGALGGMAWAAVPALLRTRFNANEILVSLMLNYVAVLLLGYLINGPWRNPEGFAFPESRMFPDAGLLPNILSGTRLHAGAWLAVAAVAFATLWFSRSLLGFRMRVAGLAPAAARYAGVSQTKVVWWALLVGGGCAGLAGFGEVAGPIGQLQMSVSPGYGYAAIIVAFVGRLSPVGIAFAALLMSLLYLGGESAQMEMGLPSAVTGLFQGLLLFYLLGADVLVRYRIRRVPPLNTVEAK